MSRLLLISTAYNEEDYLEATAAAIAAQRRRPDLWLVVDNGSSDRTPEVIERLAAEHNFVRGLNAPEWPSANVRYAPEIKGFNWALGEVADFDWDFVGKLDVDILLDPGHFERLLHEFEGNPRLGIAGSFLVEEHEPGLWIPNFQPENHVNGGVKLYRRDCFDAIGGIQARNGWDTIDQTYARMRGWDTQSFRDLTAKHLRRSGVRPGLEAGVARFGECVWVAHYPPELVLARGLRIAVKEKPRLLKGFWFLRGYVKAAVERQARVEDPEFRRFIRREQRGRIRSALRRPPPGVSF